MQMLAPLCVNFQTTPGEDDWKPWGQLEAKESGVMSFLGLGTSWLNGGFREVK